MVTLYASFMSCVTFFRKYLREIDRIQVSKLALSHCVSCLQRHVCAVENKEHNYSIEDLQSLLLQIYRMWQHCLSVKQSDVMEQLKTCLIRVASLLVSCLLYLYCLLLQFLLYIICYKP